MLPPLSSSSVLMMMLMIRWTLCVYQFQLWASLWNHHFHCLSVLLPHYSLQPPSSTLVSSLSQVQQRRTWRLLSLYCYQLLLQFLLRQANLTKIVSRLRVRIKIWRAFKPSVYTLLLLVKSKKTLNEDKSDRWAKCFNFGFVSKEPQMLIDHNSNDLLFAFAGTSSSSCSQVTSITSLITWNHWENILPFCVYKTFFF